MSSRIVLAINIFFMIFPVLLKQLLVQMCILAIDAQHRCAMIAFHSRSWSKMTTCVYMSIGMGIGTHRSHKSIIGQHDGSETGLGLSTSYWTALNVCVRNVCPVVGHGWKLEGSPWMRQWRSSTVIVVHEHASAIKSVTKTNEQPNK